MSDNDFNRSTELSDDEETNQEPPLSNVTSQESQQYASDRDILNVYDTSESISPNKLLDIVKGDPPHKCIRDCLEAFFEYESLRSFCQDYFSPVFKGLNDRDSFSTIITGIISHCDEHGKMEYLWEGLRSVRPSRQPEFEAYYQRWKEAIKRSHTDRINTNQYAYIKQGNDTDATFDSENNPLEQKGEEFAQWFFRKLKKEEQSLLLTTALFEGLSRRKMIDIAKTLDDILSK